MTNKMPVLPSMERIINDETYTPNKLGYVLDVGCGYGTLGFLLKTHKEVKELYGIDIYNPYIEHCRKLGGIYDYTYGVDISEHLPFTDKSFDNVYCLEVLEHIHNKYIDTVIEELKRIGKRVVITTPTKFFRSCSYDTNPYQFHQSRITKERLESHGFKVRGIGYLKHTPINSWRLAALFPKQHDQFIAIWHNKL